MSTFIYSQKNIIDINQKGSDINSELTQNEKNQIISFNSAIRARQINFNDQLRSIKSINEGEVIKIYLFNDKSFDAVIKNVITDVNGTKTITSKINGFEFAYCIITISDQATMMKIDIPENKEKYITRMRPQERTTYILQLDINNLDELEGSSPIIPENLNDLKNENSNQEKQNIKLKEPASQLKLDVNDPATIDVMIVYTPAASAWATTNEGSINNTIADAMANANLASSNSGLGITFNLVHSYEVNYTEVTASDDLDALTTNGDGIIDDVHTNRDLYSADMVPMFTLENLTGGLGWLLNNKYGKDNIAFCINRVQQASWSYTMIHEMGHNMGAHHHKDQITQPGPTSWTNWAENTWSAGWRWTDGANYYCDLMTYSGSGDFADGHSSTRIAYFSSPNFTDHGQTTGDAVYGDNARTLKEVKHYVAQYKDATTQLYCAAKGVASNYYISNVQIGNIIQPSSGSSYSDFSFNTTDVTIGVNQQLTVSIGNPFSTNQLLVWVDWNNDKDFSDANEAVYVSSIASANQYITNINPPLGTTTGEKRMRIRLHISNYNGNTTPCGDSDYGDVEDYTLNVLPSASTYNVTFNVTDGTNPISGANVTFNSTTQLTNASGDTVFSNVSPETDLAYSITKTGYITVNGTVNVVDQNVVENVVMGTSIPTTHLTTGSCGLITSSKTSIVSTYIVSGAQAYEFEFTNNDLPFQQILSNTDNPVLQYVRLYMVTNIKYGRTYNVRSRVKVNNVWSAWSPSCNVTLIVPTTTITPGSCGISTTSLNTIVSTYIRTGAQAYEFEFTNSEGFLQTLSNTDNPIFQYVRLYMITGIKYGRTYNIRSRVKIDDMWSDWSSEVCQLTLNVPVTSITTGSCGLITTNTNSIISAYIVANTQAYQFEFTNAGLVFTRTLTNPSNPTTQYVRLYMVPGILRGYTYIVKVRIMVDGMWGAWSNTCNVTLNNISKQNEQGQSFIASNTDFVTYPNPFTENVILYINGPSDTEYIITAYDITGKILYNSSGYSGQEITFGKEWVKGMYIISVNGPDYAGSCKVIKTD